MAAPRAPPPGSRRRRWGRAASLHAGALDVAVRARAAAAAPRHLLLLGRGGAGGAPAPRPSAWLTNGPHRRVKWSFHLSV